MSDDPETVRCDQCGQRTVPVPREDDKHLCPRCDATLRYGDRCPASGYDPYWYLDAGYYRDPTH